MTTTGQFAGLLCALILASCNSRPSEALELDPLTHQREEVRRFVELERLAARIDANAGVAAVWPDPRQFLPEDEDDWELYRDEVELTEITELVERRSLLRKGDAQLTIEVFVSSCGPRPVLQRLEDTLLGTSIGYQRYEHGPKDIGDLCLVLPLPNPTVLVVDRNVLLTIRRNNHVLDIVHFARAFAAFMDENGVAKLGARCPTFSVSLSSETPRVGEPVRLHLKLPKETPDDEPLWTVVPGPNGDAIELRDKGRDYADLVLGKAGPVEVSLFLADRRTLLSAETRLRIVVRE